MRALVVGGGAREHALVWKLRSSPRVSAIFAAPGNAGISLLAHTAPIAGDDIPGLVEFALANSIDLTVVGPEGPLAAGIVDAFQEAGLRVFGPTRAAARIESSKVWAKSLMQRHGIPTARWAVAEKIAEARAQIQEFGAPVVVKADGLAAGKGATVCRTVEEAYRAVDDLLERRILGAAGERVVIEEFLEGEELSVFALADGEHVLPLIGARDYKPLLDGDRGPNTGGMGGFAPAGDADLGLIERVRHQILEPTVAAMAADGAPFIGVLYAGLMLTEAGPKVLEFNCRWGDPEAEVILPLLRSDLAELMEACLERRLPEMHVDWETGCSCGVVLAAGGYPDALSKGDRIAGLEALEDGALVFHGATRVLPSEEPHGVGLGHASQHAAAHRPEVVTDGGRVLIVVATAPTLSEARTRAYDNVQRIHFDGMQYRRDIAIERGQGSGAGGQGDGNDGGDAENVGERQSAGPRPLAPDPGEAGSRPLDPDLRPPIVAVLMGSESDRPVMEETTKALDRLAIPSETHVMSAHRTPERVRQFARSAEARGIRVVIAGAGGAAHLPGVIAAQTTLPVIGVPIAGGAMMGLDSLLSIVQMPGGVPVATVAVGAAGARNAAYLAAAMIGLADEDVRKRYRQFRSEQSGGEIAADD